MKILALATCHNRRELTLRALHALQRQAFPSGCNFEICLVDDGSSDGTGQAVRAAFPSVTVLDGPGNLFWAGGMRFGWTNFVSGQDPDYLLVFNDDIKVAENALDVLLSAARTLEHEGCAAFAVSGALINPDTGETAYGGAVRQRSWHPLRFRSVQPTDAIQDCDTINMNITLISRAALGLVGFLAADFVHGRADYDFGLRLRAAGGRLVLAPGYLGECRINPLVGTSSQEDIHFSERWRRLTSVKEQPLRERATFYRQHGGWLWPFFWALPYIRIGLESGVNYLKKVLKPRPNRQSM